MEHEFYTFDSKVSYGRSPIQILSFVDYERYTLFKDGTNLVKENKFKVEKGTKWYDILPFFDSLNFAISERLKIEFENESISGWSSFPIEIVGHPDKKYHVLQVLAEAGELLNREALNNYETEKHEFDLNTWNGEDIFSLQGTALIVCTPRVKEIFEKLKVTNIEVANF